MNTLLQYRFVRKSSDSVSQNGDQQTSPTQDITRLESQEATQGTSQDSITTIPASSNMETSEPSSPTSPVIGMRQKVIRPVIYDTDESQEPDSSPWFSKQEGIAKKIANGSTVSQKLKKFRRLRTMSESDSDDASTVPPTPTSSQSTLPDEDGRSRTEKINQLKAMFPIRATSQLSEAVDLFNGDTECIVNALMDGKFDRELLDRKRKRESSLSSPVEENRQFKRIRMMQNSDSIETISSDSSQVTFLDSETRDQRLAVMVETFPDFPEEVLIKALEDTNWSTEDAVLSLATYTVNGNDTEKEKDKKKEKKKVMTRKDEDLSDEDDDYFGDDWDSDESMEEEEAMGQTQAILSFFEEATLEELMTVPGCSKKKAECILSIRPFKIWDTLVQKFDTVKSLSYNLISGCKETIHVRGIVTKLMKRCEKIAEEMESVVTTLTNPNTADSDRITKQPSLLSDKLELKPYQMIGLNWLRIMHSQELNGILADEMGLGKTIQAIAFLSHLIEHGDTGPHVIIVPSSTIDNWLREAKTWCPSMKVTIYYGSQDERRYVRHGILVEGKRDFNVLLTTYNIATGSVEDRALFKKCPFHYAIFDEGHMLKNMGSLRFQNLMKIRAERRLLLTGTPLQNNLVELMSLLCFVMPDLFIGKTEPLKRIFAMIGRQAGEETQGRYEKGRIAQAKRIMKPFVLRRLKQDVLSQLPKKTEEVCRCPMLPEQQELYESLIRQYSQQMENNDNPGGGMSMFMQLRKVANHPLLVRNIFNDDKISAMAKQIAKEPSHRDRGALPALIQEDMAVLNDYDINHLCEQYKKYVGSYALNIEHIKDSGKFRMLDELLTKFKEKTGRGVPLLVPAEARKMLEFLSCPEIRKKAGVSAENNFLFANKASSVVRAGTALNEVKTRLALKDPSRILATNLRKHTATIAQGDRVLLFSQFVMMLDVMEPYLQDRGIKYLRLDGSTPVPERQRLIDEYNEDPEIYVFLLSTRAGGLGINLTAANVVILHDIDFNPYNDKQAEDRCHRLGQTRQVQIVRLISKDTVEEAMLKCAQEKLKLERDVTTSSKGEDEEESTDVVSLLKEAFNKYKKKAS